MTNCKIFFSWQSDVPQSRGFISDCLKRVEKQMSDSLIVEVDRDTAGMPGSPNIESSILGKIDSCDLFVADVTIINSGCEKQVRKMPNPNVLLELGYAIKTLGWERIILMYDKTQSDAEELPFDISHQRMMPFDCGSESPNGKKRVVSNICETIRLLAVRDDMHNRERDSARSTIERLLRLGVYKAWRNYEQDWLADTEGNASGALSEDYIAVSDAQIAMVEQIQQLLTEDQYIFLHRLLSYLKLAFTGNDDKHGWEFGRDIVHLCIEPLYLGYYTELIKLPYEEILTREYVELYNALADADCLIPYSPRRTAEADDGENTVFISEPGHCEAYDSKGNTLCCYDIDEDGLISGYRQDKDYAGEYLFGKRHGEGREFGHCFHIPQAFGKTKRNGRWENDVFVEGTEHNVIVHAIDKNLNDYEVIDNGYDDNMTVYDRSVEPLMREERPDKCKNYYIADMKLKDGEYDVIEKTVKPVCAEIGGVINLFCDGCEADGLIPLKAAGNINLITWMRRNEDFSLPAGRHMGVYLSRGYGAMP